MKYLLLCCLAADLEAANAQFRTLLDDQSAALTSWLAPLASDPPHTGDPAGYAAQCPVSDEKALEALSYSGWFAAVFSSPPNTPVRVAFYADHSLRLWDSGE